MYLFFEEGHLHPACISNRSPGMRLQAGFDAAPDLILCVPYFETSSTKAWMYFLNSSLKSGNRHALASVEILAGFGLNNTTNKRIQWIRLRQNLNNSSSNGNWARRFPRPGKIRGDLPSTGHFFAWRHK